MVYSSLILKSLDDFVWKPYVVQIRRHSNFRRRLNQRSTPAWSLGNGYPDHLFLGARRLLHCIALRLPDKRNGAGRTVSVCDGRFARPAVLVQSRGSTKGRTNG